VIVLVADRGESRREANQITAVKKPTRRATGYIE